MSPTEHRSRRPRRPAGTALGISLVLLLAAACGGEDARTGRGFQKIAPSESVYTIADFEAAGFKKLKQYDVAELPAGVGAWMGYWGPDPYSRRQ
ncbi:MAG: hypothetical protein FJ313_07335 [Gemmatimonadetes bacterium]|nr:hypothetical protein [Gemmatimonadota bacterium]